MPIEILTGDEREGAVGQASIIAVQVTDAAGNIVQRAAVTFRAQDPDAVAFEDGRPYCMAKTNSKGIAEISATPTKAGDQEVKVKAGTDETLVTIKAKDTGVADLGGGAAAVRTPSGETIIVQVQQPAAVAAPQPRQGRIVVLNLTGRR